MFKSNYVGFHGFHTFARGVWFINDDGEQCVRVTTTGRPDDEIAVGEEYTLDEINAITDGDVYAYAEKCSRYAVA